MTSKRFELIWLAGIKCLMPVVDSKRKGSMLCISTVGQHIINWIKTDMQAAKKVQVKSAAKPKAKPKAKTKAKAKAKGGKKRKAAEIEDEEDTQLAAKVISGWVPAPSATAQEAEMISSKGFVDSKETEWLDTLNTALNSVEMPLRLRGTTLEDELPDTITFVAIHAFVLCWMKTVTFEDKEHKKWMALKSALATYVAREVMNLLTSKDKEARIAQELAAEHGSNPEPEVAQNMHNLLHTTSVLLQLRQFVCRNFQQDDVRFQVDYRIMSRRLSDQLAHMSNVEQSILSDDVVVAECVKAALNIFPFMWTQWISTHCSEWTEFKKHNDMNNLDPEKVPPAITDVFATFATSEDNSDPDDVESLMVRAVSIRSVYIYKCLASTMDVCLPVNVDEDCFVHMSAIETTSESVLIQQWQNVVAFVSSGHLVPDEEIRDQLVAAFSKEAVDTKDALSAVAVHEDVPPSPAKESSRRLHRKATPIDINAIVAPLVEEDLGLQCVQKIAPETSTMQTYIQFLRNIRFTALMPACTQKNSNGIYFIKQLDGSTAPCVCKMTQTFELQFFGDVDAKASSLQRMQLCSHLGAKFSIEPSDSFPAPCFAWTVPIFDDPDEATMVMEFVEKKFGEAGGKVTVCMPILRPKPEHIDKKNVVLSRGRYDLDLEPTKKYNKGASTISKKLSSLLPAKSMAPSEVTIPAAQKQGSEAPAHIKHLLT